MATPIATTSSGEAGDSPTSARVAEVLRDIARGGIAAVLTGLTVGGLGGRLVMSVAAIINPQATGLRTDAGELVGAITGSGTLALVVFGGLLLGGLVGGVVWVIVSPWVPGRGLRRALVSAVVAVALGALFLVRAGSVDFVILEHDAVLIALLIALVAVLGGTISLVDDLLERVLPHSGRSPRRALAGYGLIAGLGSFGVLIALGAYVSANGATEVGFGLIVVGFATSMAWAERINSGATEPLPEMRKVGRIALGGTVLLGFLHLTGATWSILVQA